MQRRNSQDNSLGRWLAQLLARSHQNVAIVALANKLLSLGGHPKPANEGRLKTGQRK
jgi:hypothetical protein